MGIRVRSFGALGPRFWDHRRCIRTDHYLARRDERGFDERLLPELWETGEWRVDGEELVVAKRFAGDETWELVVGVDADFVTPQLVSIRFCRLRAA